MIRKANISDLEKITALARIVANELHASGIDQWSNTYPALANFRFDLDKDGLFIYEEDGILIGSITILPENDPFYKELVWTGKNAHVVHRLMVEPGSRRKQIGRQLFQYALEIARTRFADSVKVDTHPDNYRMQSLILSLGFTEIGYIRGMNRIGYELILKT